MKSLGLGREKSSVYVTESGTIELSLAYQKGGRTSRLCSSCSDISRRKKQLRFNAETL